MRKYFVYILTNWNNKVMYIGVTDDLEQRLWEHQAKVFIGFTAKYNVNKLVYYEEHNNALVAAEREKQLKRWRREKKNALVVKMNPKWENLCAPRQKDPSTALGMLKL